MGIVLGAADSEECRNHFTSFQDVLDFHSVAAPSLPRASAWRVEIPSGIMGHLRVDVINF